VAFSRLNTHACRNENLVDVLYCHRRAVRTPFDAKEAYMSILAWIVLGLVAGFIASKLVSRSGGSLVVDLVLGIVGAVVGGFLFNQFGSAGVTGLNLYSLLVAVIGAVVVLAIYHAFTGRRAL
jgi:uncharacterized membrane protein YeaQ/YmgE (transglycosylase-associated protein family)